MRAAGQLSARALAFVLAALLAVALPAVVWAKPPNPQRAAAEALYRQGRKLMKEEKHAEACRKFSASQELDAAVGTLLFLGECSEQLGKRATALAAFQDAAALAEELGDDKRQRIAEVRAAALEPQVSTLAVVVSGEQEGLVVRRDGVEQPRAIWGTMMPVDANAYRIEATAPGKRPWTKTVTIVDGGDPVSVNVPVLQDIESNAPPGSGADDGVSTGTALRVTGLVVAGVGVVGVVIGSVFGALASSSNDESLARCRTLTLCSDEGLTLHDEAETRATVSTIGFVAGGVLVAGGLTMFFLAPSDDAQTDGQDADGVALRLDAGPSQVGLTVGGRW